MKIAILTSRETRHRYFVNALRRAVDVRAVVYQNTGYVPADTDAGNLDAETQRWLDYHFAERARQEEAYFGRDAALVEPSEECAVLQADPKTLSSAETLAFLCSQGVEAVAVYGTSLIREPLLSAYSGRMLNMHLGLSPYYRGTATNFYPLLNEEPEYVGATIHMIDAGIDSGAIVHHARPQIDADDMPHTVGCKAILAGIDKMIQGLNELARGELRAVPQWTPRRERLYLRKDYHPRQVVELYRKIEAGLFTDYAARREQAEATVKLIP